MSEMGFAGIHAKLRRAEEHIKKITDEAHRLGKDVQQGIVREVRDDVDEQVWVYRGETPNVPAEWLVILGEIFYNLRSSLDHLVWQLVLANGKPPVRSNQFPIATNEKDWQHAKKVSLRGVSERHKDMIHRLQPYTGGISFPFNVDMLTSLNKLCNIDKHRQLLVTVVANTEIRSPLLEPGGLDHLDSSARPPLEGTSYYPVLKAGSVLLRFNNVAIDISPSFQIDLCFEDSRPTFRILHVLEECRRTVKGSVDWCTMPMGDAFHLWKSEADHDHPPRI